ncbi:MAG TPA: substrate-binding domain-containing protein [Acidobacteriota bacterium]|nr:substrate-binding domain-containing protein [Acidobacteriota bacterium]
MKWAFITALFWGLLTAGCAEPTALEDNSRDSIAVIPKGTTQMFWKSVEAGAQQAGKELDVNIIWKGPLKENDRALQIALVEQFVTEGVSGIVLAPLDDTALSRPVHAAAGKGIPVVIFDSSLKGEIGKDFVSFVATDNLAGGRMAGEQVAEILSGEGKVAMLRYQVGSASTTRREQGFLESMSQHPGIEVILDNQYGGATSGETIQKSEELLDTLREADAIFCPNEATTYGMLVALRKHNLTGKVKFVGFDSSEELLRAMRKSEIDALVVQNPRKMGYLGVVTLVSHLRGEKVPERIDTGVAVVTADRLSDPEIKELLEIE